MTLAFGWKKWRRMGRAVRVLDHENLARVRLRMKAQERQAARMAPRKYGNRRKESGPSLASLRGKGFRTRGGTFRSSSDPADGTRAPGASWASLGSTTRSRAGFRHVFSDPRCLLSRYLRLHDTLHPTASLIGISARAAREQRRTHAMDNRSHCHTRCKKHAGSPELPSSPASQEPSRLVTSFAISRWVAIAPPA